MRASKHTPGPWSVYEAKILLMTVGDYDHRREELETNARLIAAAPEMLEALKFMAKYMRGRPGDMADSVILERFEEIIAKAGGRS